MPFPTLTYTLTNGTVADASQVMQDFNDLLNGMTDGTKSLNISAITAAGTATFNGNIVLGASSANTIATTGSYASSLSFSANNTYDIGGATLAPSSIYLGAPSSRSTRLRANQSLSASNTLTFPDTGGTSRYFMETDGSGNLSWVKPKLSPYDIKNYSLSTAVAANALTITFLGANGSALSSTNAVVVPFRNASPPTGTPGQIEITSNITLTISSGSTMGFISGVQTFLYIYLANNAGTPLLCASSTPKDEGSLFTTTAEGGAGAADNYAPLYSSSGVATLPIRYIGRIALTEATAGTWATNASEIAYPPCDNKAMRFIPSSASWSTNCTFSGSFFIKDGHIRIIYYISLSGAPNTAALGLSWPTGMQLNTLGIPSGAGGSDFNMGTGVSLVAGANRWMTALMYGSNTAFLCRVPVVNLVSGYINMGADISQAVPATYANGDFVCFTTYWLPFSYT